MHMMMVLRWLAGREGGVERPPFGGTMSWEKEVRHGGLSFGMSLACLSRDWRIR